MPNFDDRDQNRPIGLDRDRVEDTHAEHIRVERRPGTPWRWLLLGLIPLGALAIMMMPHPEQQQAAVTTTNQVATTTTTEDAPRVVTFNNQQWEVKGAPQSLPADQLRQVGTTEQGEALYARPVQNAAGGGGGGEAMATDNTQMYMMAADGRFQPLVLKK